MLPDDGVKDKGEVLGTIVGGTYRILRGWPRAGPGFVLAIHRR